MTHPTRRALMTALALSPLWRDALAQKPDDADYPEKLITALVGFAAGGPTDVAMRKLADSARKTLGQQVLIDNKPGAAGSLAISQLAKRSPDGYSIGAILIGAVINQHIRKVDYAVEELSPIIMFGTLPQGIVVPAGSAWKTLPELFAHAKANPGSVRYSTAGIGTGQHFSMERLGLMLGIRWTHVPYKSATEAVTAVLSGEVDACAQTAEWSPFVKEGKLRLLATMTEQRMPDFPQAPTLRESGYDVVAPSLMGVVGPKGMSPARLEKLHRAFKAALDTTDFQATLKLLAITPDYRPPAEFGAYLKSASRFYADIAKSLPNAFGS